MTKRSSPKKSKYAWQETTSYPRVSTARVPAEWRLELPHSTLVLHRLRGCDPNQWFGTCRLLGIVDTRLGESGTSDERAKSWLIELCIDRCKPQLDELIAARGSK